MVSVDIGRSTKPCICALEWWKKELKNGTTGGCCRFQMNRTFIIIGLIIAILGAGGYVDSSYTHIILTGTHHTIPLLGLGIAVLGALVTVGGVTMGGSTSRTANEFKCSVCGATFGSQGALDQHTKAKHPTQA